jgi:hypothetical protein
MTLIIELRDTNAAVASWPASGGKWVLQSGDAKTAWIISTNPVVVAGSRNEALITPLSGNMFFRLFHP